MPDSGKKLSELRICDLKEELEKRNLETVGAKATLVERLEQVVITHIHVKIDFTCVFVHIFLYFI